MCHWLIFQVLYLTVIIHYVITLHITDSLNGNLRHDQTIHRRDGVGKNVFSTQKPISFLVNVTDVFKNQPSFTYKWYSDGQPIDADNYDNRTISIQKPGGHNVSVIISSNGLSSDCKGYFYENNLKGSFHASFVLKGKSGYLFMPTSCCIADKTVIMNVLHCLIKMINCLIE